MTAAVQPSLQPSLSLPQSQPAPVRLADSDIAWLCELMALPSVSPFEGGDLDATVLAQRCFRDGAVRRGFTPLRWDRPDLDFLDRPGVPEQVRRAAAGSARFLTRQPSVVVSLGSAQPPARRLVINFHTDTVGPHVPPTLSGRVLHGRGAVDDKGPGVAAVAGVAAAFATHPALSSQVEVQIASVPGEEGGAMGVYGTRWLVETGCVGRLMVFAEPTGCRVLDACSAAMTPLLSVHGDDSTDDHPYDGHNATLALGWLAVRLAERLGPLAESVGAKLCVAGLHTGESHNRVYGTGELRCNIAYFDAHAASVLADAVPVVVAEAGAELASRFAGGPVAARLAADWSRVVRLRWLKRGLPPLGNRDPELEAVLAAAGLPRHDGIADGSAFTCDAIWAAGPDRYVAVCGPGRLDRNGAHTPDEHVDLDDLDRYATHVRDLVLGFAAHAATHTAAHAAPHTAAVDIEESS